MAIPQPTDAELESYFEPLLVPIAGMMLVYGHPLPDFEPICFDLLLIEGVVLVWGMIGVHELGHAIVGRALGWPIKALTVGGWFNLVTLRIRGAVIQLGAAPTWGLTEFEARAAPAGPLRHACLDAAGVAAGFTALLVAWLVPGPAALTDASAVFIAFGRFVIMWKALRSARWCLDPAYVWIRGERLKNDGWNLEDNILALARPLLGKVEAWDAVRFFDPLWTARRDWVEGRRAEALISLRVLSKRWWWNKGNYIVLGMTLRDCGDTLGAERAWRRVRQSRRAESFARSARWKLAELAAFHGRKDLLPEADAWIKTAIGEYPDCVLSRMTQIGVLYETGEIGSAWALLEAYRDKVAALKSSYAREHYLPLIAKVDAAVQVEQVVAASAPAR